MNLNFIPNLHLDFELLAPFALDVDLFLPFDAFLLPRGGLSFDFLADLVLCLDDRLDLLLFLLDVKQQINWISKKP